MRHLEVIVEASEAELSSALWYLKQRGLAASDDKSSLADHGGWHGFPREHQPAPEAVMLFIKPPPLRRRTGAARIRPKPEVESVMSDTESRAGADLIPPKLVLATLM